MPDNAENIALLDDEEWEHFKAYVTAKSAPEEEKELEEDVKFYLCVRQELKSLLNP